MITLIHGEEAFSAAQEVSRLTDELVEPSWRSVNLTVLEGATAVSDVIAAARSAPFFGNRLVVVRNCPWFNPATRKGGTETPEDPEPATDGPAVVALLETGLAEGCHLILVVPRKIHAGMTTSRAALAGQKAGRVRIAEFVAPDPFRKQGSYDWVVRRAQEIGGSIAPEAAQFLVDRLGQERYLLDQELRKLTSYAAGRRVERQDVVVLSPPGEADVFELVEAIVGRQPVVAVTSLRRLCQVDHPLKILATMGALVRAYLQEKVLAERRRSVDDIAAVVRRKPGRVRMDLDLLRRWTPDQLLGAQGALMQAETDLKRSAGSDQLVLERLVVQLVNL